MSTLSTLVIVPSRGRPDNIRRLIDGFQSTIQGDTHLLVAVDDDDPALPGYLEIETNFEWLNVTVGPRLRLGGTLNALAPKFVHSFDIIGFMGDDHLPRTVGWDLAVSDAMSPAGVVYGNDLIQGANLPTAVFMNSSVVKSLGYFVPRGLIHLYFDNTWKDWGEASNQLVYLDHIVIEHLHPLAGTAENDAGYEEVNSGAMYSADEARYQEYHASGEFAADVEKLRSL